jgi:two-component system response regulator HydG
MQLVNAVRPAIVILDLMLPGRSGLELTSEILQLAPTTDVLLLTGHYTLESAIEAIRLAACDYLTKPIQIAALRARVGRLLEDLHKRLEAARLGTALVCAHRLEGMVGHSAQILELFR